MKYLLCAKCFVDIIPVNPYNVRCNQHLRFVDEDAGGKVVQGFTQGRSTVKWQNQELILVWIKQITLREVEKGGTGFLCRGRSINMGTQLGRPMTHMEKIEWFTLPETCIR